MSKIRISETVKDLSEDISISAFHHVEHYFPVDRFFIEKYNFITDILKVDALEFLLCNLESTNTTYTIQLMLCLPELWEEINYEDILNLLENFTNSFSFYAFISFTYKYLDINLFDELFTNKKIKLKFKKDTLDYFLKTSAILYLDEDDLIDFEENLMGINLNDWSYTKQKLLIDDRFKPTKDLISLNKYLKKVREKIDNDTK